MSEREHQVEVPAGVWELTWLRARLTEEAAALGADITPDVEPEIIWDSEDLGQGETRKTMTMAWDLGPIHVFAEVDEHEIYDGATPRWGYVRGRVDGLPEDRSIKVSASLSVGKRTATITITEPRSTSPSGGGR